MQNYDQDVLKNLTIVLPTYERQDYLIRFLNYWSDKQAQIIVMDGSKKSLHYEIIKNLSKNIKFMFFRDLNCVNGQILTYSA